MDEARFWRIVGDTKSAAREDRERQVHELLERLSELEPAEIVDFDRIYHDLLARAYSWDLWGAAYVIGSGCSDDGFEYFRDWLISKGRAAYDTALRDPEALADIVTHGDADEGCEFEDFRYAALQAWERRTGKDGHHFPVDKSTQQPEEPTGQPWEEDADELARRYPRLWAKFGS